MREVDDADGLAIGEALSAGLLVSSLALLGEVFYAGVVSALVSARRGGRWHSLREVAGELPYMRLIAVDLLFIVLVIAGLLLFVVPGVIAIGLFVLAGPVMEIERPGVRAAFRRSRQLAQGNVLRILALLIPLLVIGDALAEAAAASGLWILGEGVAGHWLGVVVTEVLTVPLFGLSAAVMAHTLIQARPLSLSFSS